MKGKKRVAAALLIILAIVVDAFLCINVDSRNELVYRVVVCVLFDAVIAYGIANVEALFRVPLDIYRSRDMFWGLVKNDFQARFVGSVFGVIWAFINPVITMLLYWFVFQVGLGASDVDGFPFILYLMSGLIPWFYFQEALNGGTNTLLEYTYLVKKLVFNVGILPVLKVASALFVHVFFLVFLLGICSFYGLTPCLYTLQIFYYIACSMFLVLGLSYITAACTAFFRDVTQVVAIALMVGTWMTPIMWNARAVLSPVLAKIFELNPMFYVVDGFRDAFLYHKWFWEKPVWTAYFWMLSLLIYIFGVKFFNRLKIHFSDVL